MIVDGFSLYVGKFVRRSRRSLCHASELPAESCTDAHAALFARPALDAEVSGGVLAHVGFPAEFEAAGESLEGW